MNAQQVREWLRNYAKENGDLVLENNINMYDDYRIWKEYAIRMAEKDKVKIGRYLVEEEAKTPKEVKALRIAQKLFERAYLSRFGIVYKPHWLDDEGEEVVTVDFRAVVETKEFLKRYEKLTKFIDNLTESEKEALKKLLD